MSPSKEVVEEVQGEGATDKFLREATEKREAEKRRLLTPYPVEVVKVSSLKPHPQNYRVHPEDQIAHIVESIREHGVYRNIVVAEDSTILAGHGVVQAAKRLGLEEVPVIRVPVQPFHPRALKLLTGDNEIAHLGEADDRALSEILKKIKEEDEIGLLGTGYDEKMLANLVMVTRPASEIKDFDEAAEWVGLPGYEEGEDVVKLVMSFRTEEDRDEFMKKNDLTKMGGNLKTWTSWWPPKQRDDSISVKFVG